jgi:hypothetical protein
LVAKKASRWRDLLLQPLVQGLQLGQLGVGGVAATSPAASHSSSAIRW